MAHVELVVCFSCKTFVDRDQFTVSWVLVKVRASVTIAFKHDIVTVRYICLQEVSKLNACRSSTNDAVLVMLVWNVCRFNFVAAAG